MDNLVRAIDNAVASNDYKTLARIFSSSTSDNTTNSWQTVGPGEQRSLAAHLLQVAVASDSFLPEAFDSPLMQQVFQIVLHHLPATVENAADNKLRLQWFAHKITTAPSEIAESAAVQVDYSGAARILGGMRLENTDDPASPYYLTLPERADIFLQMAECFLASDEDEDAEADAAVNRAGALIEQFSAFEKQHHSSIVLRYKSSYARILDAHRKFVPASQRYHELSQSTINFIDDDDLLVLLGMAVTCAILSGRQRVMAPLVQDERLSLLDNIQQFASHGTLLRKLHAQHLVRPHEWQPFEATLAEHQRATMADGYTILERRMMEHNMMAASQIYQSIYLTDLQKNILGVSTVQQAEQIAANMILEQSLPAGTCLNQVEGLLEFPANVTAAAAATTTTSSANAGAAVSTSSNPSDQFNEAIHNFCVELNKVAEAIAQH